MRIVLLLLLVVCVANAARFPIKVEEGDVEDDKCAPEKTCQTCILTGSCGWCSTPVIGGSNGTQCAGIYPNGTSPFICIGTFQTTTCLVPTTGSTSTSSSSSSSGHATTGGTTGSTSTTGLNPVPPVQGFWRGLQINVGYPRGEWNFTFAMDNFTAYGPNSQMFVGNIYAGLNEMDLTVTAGDGKGATYHGIFELDFGPASEFLTWALAPLGTSISTSDWPTAMKSTSYRVWIMEQPKF